MSNNTENPFKTSMFEKRGRKNESEKILEAENYAAFVSINLSPYSLIRSLNYISVCYFSILCIFSFQIYGWCFEIFGSEL